MTEIQLTNVQFAQLQIDLKHIVESHELVVQCGGLEDARSHLESIRFNIATKTWFGQALLNWSMYADKLEKAIADVESCMEVSSESN